jgi:hypothetical protein
MMYDLTTYSPHGNQMVFVYIGTHGTPIRVHEKLLLLVAPTFSKMLIRSPDQASSLPASLILDGELRSPVETFTHWMYHRTLPEIELANVRSIFGTVWKRVVLYAFAEKYQVIDLMDQAMDSIIEVVELNGPSAQIIEDTYGFTSPRSLLRLYLTRAFIAHIMVYPMNFDQRNDMAIMASKAEFVHDVFMEMHDSRREIAEGKLARPNCTYHAHGRDSRCSGNS